MLEELLTKRWSENDKLQVWNKGKIVPGYDSNKYRLDECNAWMEFAQYGNRKSILGWEIDHIKPLSQGGSDNITNLRPLQWENNAAKSDGRLVCVVKAIGNQNTKVAN